LHQVAELKRLKTPTSHNPSNDESTVYQHVASEPQPAGRDDPAAKSKDVGNNG
jgi:hypothetical protein